MDKEKFFDSIDSAPKFGDAHKNDLESILTSPALIAAFASAVNGTKLSAERFRSLDFTKQDGVATAIRLQGHGDGVTFLLEHLVDLTQEKDDAD